MATFFLRFHVAFSSCASILVSLSLLTRILYKKFYNTLPVVMCKVESVPNELGDGAQAECWKVPLAYFLAP